MKDITIFTLSKWFPFSTFEKHECATGYHYSFNKILFMYENIDKSYYTMTTELGKPCLWTNSINYINDLYNLL